MTEIQANKEKSDIDLMWINGETFYQLKQINGLFGPWTSQLPNAKYIDLKNPFIGIDFQQPIEGFEMPWGNVQMAIIYNSEKVINLPQTRAELASFVKQNPGIFTFDNQFTGLTFLKALLIDISGSKEELSGDFDQVKYDKYSKELWKYLKELKPYLWRKGTVFPESVAQMHQLFANGELWFTMSNNDAEVDSKIQEGLFSDKAMAYVPTFGTIQNSHYMGIPSNSGHKTAAMVVANTLISVEAQAQKMNPIVWGDGTVLDMKSLTDADRAKFENIPSRKKAPKRVEIQSKALKELAPEYMVKLAEDFRKNIINN
jgi:putative spermidine/putrescine transport system substrate-binding protein